MGKVGQNKSSLVAELPSACRDEGLAVEFIERQRWGNEPACPHCGDTSVYQMRARATGKREKHYRWRCRGCRKQFSARTGTVFEDSRIPLRLWLHGFWRMSASKKGISSLQIQRETGLSYKSALFLTHRIRFAMADDPSPARKLTGIVEADETYVGGKPRHRGGRNLPGKRITGRATPKTPVFAVVERGGEVRATPIDRISKENLANNLRRFVDLSARLITDEEQSYRQIGTEFAGGHDTVTHSRREYARGDVTTNTIEGYFSLLKRAIYGTYHSVSKRHLHRYVSEASYKWNTRKLDDGARTVLAIQKAEGKRLRYRSPTNS